MPKTAAQLDREIAGALASKKPKTLRPTKPDRSACPMCDRVVGWEWNYPRGPDRALIPGAPKQWVRAFHGYLKDTYGAAGAKKPCVGGQRCE